MSRDMSDSLDVAGGSDSSWAGSDGFGPSFGFAAGLVAAGGVEGEGADQPGRSEDGELVAAGDDEDGLATMLLAEADAVGPPGGGARAVDLVEAGAGFGG